MAGDLHPAMLAAQAFKGVGVDIERVERFADPPRGVFTAAESAYCDAQPRPAESYAGRWCAKEAVVKCFAGTGWTPSLRDVEIAVRADGSPYAKVRSYPGIVAVSISHDDENAAAVALRPPQPGGALSPS